MAYVHKKCGGDIAIFSRKCKKCGKEWRDSASLLVPPKDWIMLVKGNAKPASYAKWGDKVPFVGTVASMLPNWPKWARILAFIVYIASIAAFIIWAVQSCT